MDASEKKLRLKKKGLTQDIEKIYQQILQDCEDFFKARRIPVKVVYVSRKYTRQLYCAGKPPRDAINELADRGELRLLISDTLTKYVLPERVWKLLPAADQLRLMDNLDAFYIKDKDD